MKDLRKDFDYKNENIPMPEGHLTRFETRLNLANSKSNAGVWLQKIAAVLIFGILISSFWFQSNSEVVHTTTATHEALHLNAYSAEFGNLEAFFKASISYELATLDYGNYEEVAFSYLEELEKIEKDYKLLQIELSTAGFNEAIIEAMIDNLQLRLELLQNLKLKLNELKTLSHEKDQTYQL